MDRQGDIAFEGSIPGLYDRLLAPLLFEPFANEMAGRFAGFEGDLLEVAAGTGILTRALDRSLPKGARIVATDLNPPMIAHAAGVGASDRVSWRQADGQDLPFEDRAFDAVVCQFGVMFFPDRVQGYREARRVLRPNGVYRAAIWDRLKVNEVTWVVQEALARAFPEAPPSFMSRTPHGHGDPEVMNAELTEAGFSEVAIEQVRCLGRGASAREAAVGLCQGTPLRGEIEAHGPGALERATEVATEALRDRYGEGPLEDALQAFVLTARG